MDRIRSQPGLSTDAQRCLVARAYLKAKTAMDELRGNTAAVADARRRALTAKVWGVDDIAGTNAGDRAAARV